MEVHPQLDPLPNKSEHLRLLLDQLGAPVSPVVAGKHGAIAAMANGMQKYLRRAESPSLPAGGRVELRSDVRSWGLGKSKGSRVPAPSLRRPAGLTLAQLLVVTPYQFGVTRRHWIAVNRHERLLRGAPGEFFTDART